MNELSGMSLEYERARESLEGLLADDRAQRREAMAARARPAGELRGRIEAEMARFAERLANYLALGAGLLPASQEVQILEALGESALRLAGLLDRWLLAGGDEVGAAQRAAGHRLIVQEQRDESPTELSGNG